MGPFGTRSWNGAFLFFVFGWCCLTELFGGYSAVLGTHFLREELGVLGKLGCAICLIGSVIIVLHAPPDEDIQTIDEILNYAIQPGNYSLSGGLRVSGG